MVFIGIKYYILHGNTGLLSGGDWMEGTKKGRDEKKHIEADKAMYKKKGILLDNDTATCTFTES